MKVQGTRWILAVLLGFNQQAWSQDITWGSLYETAHDNKQLTEKQEEYLTTFLATAIAANEVSWARNKHGLFCPISPEILYPEDLLKVIKDEIGSDHGWGYIDAASAAPQLMRALAMHFECTPERERLIKQQFCEPSPDGIPSAMCELFTP